MFLGMVAHMLLNIADGVMVGRLGRNESLAVLNYGFPFFYLVFAVFNGISTGATSVLARLLGAKDDLRAERVLTQITVLSLGLFAVFLLFYPLLLPAYLEFQKAGPESARLTRDYLNTLLPGLPFTLVSLLLGSGLRAEGNMRTLMSGLLLGTLLNLLIAPFLIFGPFRLLGMDLKGAGLGVMGAGLATTSANIATLLYIGGVYLRGKSRLRLKWHHDWKDLSGVRSIFAVGLPSVLSQSLIGINIAVMTRLAAPFGEAAVAALGIGARLDTLAVFSGLSIMTAVLSMVGQNFGAGRFDRVREAIRKGLLAVFLFLGALGILVHVLRGPLVGLFEPDAATAASALHYVEWLTYGYAFVGMGMVSSGAFQGMGRGFPFLFLTALRLLLLSAPIAYLLSRHTGLGEYGLHYAPLLASFLTAIAAVTWVLRTAARLEAGAPGRAAAPAAAEPGPGNRA